MPAGESVTTKCEEALGILRSGRAIKVVDTPGILDTRNTDIRKEVTKAIAFLSPGPHAFIIVLQPNRATEEEKRVISEIQELFGDTKFLQNTIIVMVRRDEIVDQEGDLIDIHEFIDKMAAQDVKTLYEKCDKRIIAVENRKSIVEKQRYAEMVVDEISSLDGYYCHEYFSLLQENNLQKTEIAKLQKKLVECAAKNKRPYCSIL